MAAYSASYLFRLWLDDEPNVDKHPCPEKDSIGTPSCGQWGRASPGLCLELYLPTHHHPPSLETSERLRLLCMQFATRLSYDLVLPKPWAKRRFIIRMRMKCQDRLSTLLLNAPGGNQASEDTRFELLLIPYCMKFVQRRFNTRAALEERVPRVGEGLLRFDGTFSWFISVSRV
jgi:hypothetical protein